MEEINETVENNDVEVKEEVETTDKESNQVEETNKEKTFTQADVDKMIKDRLAREQKKALAEQEEAKKLAKMNADEKAKYEKDKLLEELNELKAEKSKRELKDTALGMLNEKGVDSSLIDFLDYTDADSCKASIDKLSEAWNKAIEKAINSKIKTNTVPKMKSNTTDVDNQVVEFRKKMGL